MLCYYNIQRGIEIAILIMQSIMRLAGKSYRFCIAKAMVLKRSIYSFEFSGNCFFTRFQNLFRRDELTRFTKTQELIHSLKILVILIVYAIFGIILNLYIRRFRIINYSCERKCFSHDVLPLSLRLISNFESPCINMQEPQKYSGK